MRQELSQLDKTFRPQFLANVMMIYHSLIIILTLCGVQSMKNGRRAADMEFPSVVSIQHQLFHLCSGTIIDRYHILTVAHVVIPYPASGLLVVPGMSEVEWPYIRALTVKTIDPHPDYRELTILSSIQSDLYWENDIALLQLNEPLPSDFLNELVSLSTTNLESYGCFECIMISWNYPDESNLEKVVLMWDVVYMVKNNRCEQFGIKVLANQQCFIDFFETAFISTEDLGSPITCGNSIVGLIVGEARQGEATSPATFLSTLNYTEFISKTINGETQSKRRAMGAWALSPLQFAGAAMNVEASDFPYMVSIWHGNRHVCGGIILNTHQVITAGKCIQDTRNIYPKQPLKIAAGSNRVSRFNRNVQWYTASHTDVHPHYKPSYNVNDSSWWTEHDIGLITLTTPLSWSPTVQKIRFADTDDFLTKQVCQVLRWTRKYTRHDREYRELTKANVILINYDQPLVQLKSFQIAAKELYFVDSLFIDIGNPIICGGYPFGIMVGTYSNNLVSQAPQIIFLRIRPYALGGFLVA